MRVLFLTHRLPYEPNRGDRARAFHILRTLSASMEVEVVSLAHDNAELAHVGRLRSLGVRATAFRVPQIRNYAMGAMRMSGRRPLTHSLLDAPELSAALKTIVRERPPDVVLAYCSSMARFALESPLSGFPLVVDLIDVDSQKWAALASSAPWTKRWIYRREARQLELFERRIARVAHTTLVVNAREQQLFAAIAPGADVRVLPIGVDAEALAPQSDATDQPRLVFCGVMNYAPNVDGVLWFAREIWPLIRATMPEARFNVVGSGPTARIRALATPESGIEVTGTVADVRPHLWNAAISVAPLLTARGIQNKVLEAIAAGLPAVVTPQVMEGLPQSIQVACRSAESPADFADAALSLLQMTSGERRRLAASADIRALAWESQLQPLAGILQNAAAQRALTV